MTETPSGLGTGYGKDKLQSQQNNNIRSQEAFSIMNQRLPVNIGNNKNAFLCKYLNLKDTTTASYIYLKTSSGNIYKLMKRGSDKANELITRNPQLADRREELHQNFPTDWCLYNPKTRKVFSVHHDEIIEGRPFEYVAGSNTSNIVEIVEVFNIGQGDSVDRKSSIEDDFNKLDKKS